MRESIRKGKKIEQNTNPNSLRGPLTDSEMQKVANFYLKIGKAPGPDNKSAHTSTLRPHRCLTVSTNPPPAAPLPPPPPPLLVDVRSPHVKTMKEWEDKNRVLPTLKEISGRWGGGEQEKERFITFQWHNVCVMFCILVLKQMSGGYTTLQPHTGTHPTPPHRW